MSNVTGRISANPRSKRFGGAITLLLALIVATPAYAGEPSDADRATARELGGAGLAALDAKDYPTALDRLSRALALYDVPTLRLGRARAFRGLGQFVSAAENYRAVLLRAPAKNEPPAFVQATRDAKVELQQVEAKIAHLTVMVNGTPSSLRVDGAEWPAVAIGVPRPLDPGDHVVEAANETHQLQTQKVTLNPGQSERIEIVLPVAKAVVEASPGPSGPPPLAAAGPISTAPGPTATTMSPPSHTAALVSTVVSGALAAGAIVTGILANSAKADFNEENRADVAPSRKEDLRSKASTMALVSTVLTGAALVGTGLSVYFWVAPGRTETAARPGTWISAGAVLTTPF
jgi:hypothetical protein